MRSIPKHNPVELLKIQNLSVSFFTDEGTIRAVDNFSFSMEPGKTLGLVGESGCGKSVTALSVLRLVPPPGRITGGEIFFEGKNLLSLPWSNMYGIRGNKISMIFQDPMTSLNPVFTVGEQIAEAVMIHQKFNRRVAKKRAIEMLELVRIPQAWSRCGAYPHELSGGMRQRVMIAMALSCNPLLLIADEPTTALDVTVQAEILDLMRELQGKLKMSILLITHNLGIVAEMCDEVLVMYAGRAVEKAPTKVLFKSPQHPYTAGLLTCLPSLEEDKKRLTSIPGQLPVMKEQATSCTFAPRCWMAAEICRQSEPDLFRTDEDHESRCFFWEKVKAPS